MLGLAWWVRMAGNPVACYPSCPFCWGARQRLADYHAR